MLPSVIIATTTVLLLALLVIFLHAFKAQKRIYAALAVIIVLFAIGFWLRLLEDSTFVDIGFFLTESSHLFATVMFTAALIMGQEKYWRS